MAASFNDAYQLSQDATFQNRVQAALLTYCTVVASEGWSVPFHRERAGFVSQVMSSQTTQQSMVTLFANSAATNATVLADATQAGTVVLTSGNRAAQAALVTDTHLSNAIASQFDAYIREPA